METDLSTRQPRSAARPDSEGASADGARRILFAAHDLFYRDGIRATGVDRVIAVSGVAKRTFYRHYPTKNHLVLSYLRHRHATWMRWFTGSLARHGGSTGAIVPALREWFDARDYRGCAFINIAIELSDTFPEAVEASRRHKADMTQAIQQLVADSPDAHEHARALVLAVDGAIVNVQFGESPAAVLGSLSSAIRGIDLVHAGRTPAEDPSP